MANQISYRVIKCGNKFQIQYKYGSSNEWCRSNSVEMFDILSEAINYIDEIVTQLRDQDDPKVLYEVVV